MSHHNIAQAGYTCLKKSKKTWVSVIKCSYSDCSSKIKHKHTEPGLSVPVKIETKTKIWTQSGSFMQAAHTIQVTCRQQIYWVLPCRGWRGTHTHRCPWWPRPWRRHAATLGAHSPRLLGTHGWSGGLRRPRNWPCHHSHLRQRFKRWREHEHGEGLRWRGLGQSGSTGCSWLYRGSSGRDEGASPPPTPFPLGHCKRDVQQAGHCSAGSRRSNGNLAKRRRRKRRRRLVEVRMSEEKLRLGSIWGCVYGHAEGDLDSEGVYGRGCGTD